MGAIIQTVFRVYQICLQVIYFIYLIHYILGYLIGYIIYNYIQQRNKMHLMLHNLYNKNNLKPTHKRYI